MSRNFKTGVLIIISVILCLGAMAGKKVVQFSTSESGAKIYIDGKLMGSGPLEIIILSDTCVKVKVEKTGFLSKTIIFCNKPNVPPPPKTFLLELEKDDSFEASEPTDLTNKDIEIKTSLQEAETWKVISRIITTYFDDIEMADRESGYMKTSWAMQSFKQNTVRTRLIVKPGSVNPLSYKIKLISEQSGVTQSSVKNDDLFKAWDRVLLKYKEVIHEIQTKLGS